MSRMESDQITPMYLPVDIVRLIISFAEVTLDVRRAFGLPPRRLKQHGAPTLGGDPSVLTVLEDKLSSMCSRRSRYWASKRSLQPPYSCPLDSFSLKLEGSKVIEFDIDQTIENNGLGSDTIIFHMFVIHDDGDEVHRLRGHYFDIHTGAPCNSQVGDWSDDEY